MGLFESVFDKNERILKPYYRILKKINFYKDEVSSLKAESFADKTNEFKDRLAKGEAKKSILPEAFACVREAAKRTIGLFPFDVQIIGALALNDGNIAEMKTGEGKTLVATMPLYLNALMGKGTHIATVNDYLAKRDAEWMGPVYEYMGLKYGFIQSGMKPAERKNAYEADITYGTANEFGFDYLRDNLSYSLENKVQRGHFFSIVDEADSILIDEARTPLIISGPKEDSSNLYKQFASIAKRFKIGKDYTIDEKEKSVSLTQDGIEHTESILNIENLYDPDNYKYVFHLTNALKAINFFKLNDQYVINNGEVIIVDEFTGRLLPGRRYSEGLHQAIEAKERVQIKKESVNYATITFQNYFKMYEILSGMTGTAVTEASEFESIYDAKVLAIPTNMPVIRKDKDDYVYRSKDEKYEAIVDDIVKRYEMGQPVLVGTTSIEKSEMFSKKLKNKNIPHQVLNAKFHEKEAEIVAKAGEKNTITIATNMAGRGTDIKLGDEVNDLGGLYVIGTERHESRRIDNQLIGRSGRQGDNGESRFYLSLEDDMIRLFGGEKLEKLMDIIKIEKGEPIENSLLTKVINSAQKKIEGIHFGVRKNLYELDLVMDKLRTEIYGHRDWILKGENIEDHFKEMVLESVNRKLAEYESIPDKKELKKIFGFLDEKQIEEIHRENIVSIPDLEKIVEDKILETFNDKKEEYEEEFKEIFKYIALRVIDENWKRFLEGSEQVKDSIRLRAYGQKDPLIEYKKETYKLFEEMVDSINDQTIDYMMRVKKIDKEKSEAKAQKDFNMLNAVHSDFSSISSKDKKESSKDVKHTRRFKVKK
ncbi:MAG: preprotein translocase subunit SecA [Kosmotogales bacterium]|nr:preprotein translocase subunit SecA [Kosmotogales bacterium]